MKIEFFKAEGLANDFIIINNQKNLELSKEQIVYLSNRKIGIGCDQVIIISQSDNADYLIKIFNSDGSEAESCGNAFRCIGYFNYIYNNKKTTLIETQSEIIKVEHIKENLMQASIKKILIHDVAWVQKDNPVIKKWEEELEAKSYLVDAGNPHIIFFLDKFSFKNFEEYGKLIANNKIFQNGVNVNFATLREERKIIDLNVFERGAGVTNACGTGACATFFAAFHHLNLRYNEEFTIKQAGGDLQLSHNQEQGIIMTGKANIVFKGEIEI